MNKSPLGGLGHLVDHTEKLLKSQLSLQQQNRLLADALVTAVYRIKMTESLTEAPIIDSFEVMAEWCFDPMPQTEQIESRPSGCLRK